MTKFAQLIGQMEGFGKPGATPTVDDNPGDLRHSPHSSHDGEGPNDIGKIDTIEDGWADLDRQLQIFRIRGLTIREAIYEWTGTTVKPDGTIIPTDGNNPTAYLNFICDGLGLPPETLLQRALQIPA